MSERETSQPQTPDVPHGAHRTDVPEGLRQHPLLQGSPFFTLPAPLLESVVTAVGESRFNVEILAIERQLSTLCGDHSSRIGYWRSQPIVFALLRPLRPLIVDNDVQALFTSWGQTRAEAISNLKMAANRADDFRRIAKGYLGWLATHRLFQSEQRKMLDDWETQIASYGIPRIGRVVANAAEIKGINEPEGLAEFVSAFEAFFIRWRLDGMAAPFVPIPMQPQMPIVDLRAVLGHLRHGGMAFFFPDIYPTPTRDELRKILDDALRGGEIPEHLAAWFEIVRPDNPARNKIDRYGRVFEVQHYVRALYGRHHDALSLRKTVVKEALASFLETSDDTIAKDIELIELGLGEDLMP